MGDKFRTKHGSVFSHKRAVWGGMDQGKGLVYRGDFVEFMLNGVNKDNVFKIRDGQSVKDTADAGIQSGHETVSGVTVISGTNVFFGEEIPALDL